MSLVSKIVTGAISIVAGLSQEATNGVSQWGTLDAPTYAPFLTDNPLPDGYPWSTKNVTNASPYTEAPNTGKTRRYDFTISRGKLSPDGYQKDVILINDQFPGPLIEANWGDWFEIKVHNNITGPVEGTALHWHGLLQKETPWYDGVPSVGQCPIAPGSTFTYRFRADLYGTSWYHSHYSSQYAGGLLGPMIIHGPKSKDYDIDLGHVMISDWYHKEYFQIVKEIMGTDPAGWPQKSDNNLINGKNNFDCTTVNSTVPCVSNAGLSKFQFTPGKRHRLRLINSGAAGIQTFSIDNHEMTVIANDFVPIKSYNTTVVTMGIGQRTDVIVHAKQNATGPFWMRAHINTVCAQVNQPDALAIIYYKGKKTYTDTLKPNSTAWPQTDDPECKNDDLTKTVPLYTIPADPPTVTQELIISEIINATGHQIWTINDSSFRANYNSPLLLLANQKNTSYPFSPQWNIYNFHSNSTIRIILTSNSSAISHPMHLHGHNMQILSESSQPWDGKTLINPQNPQRRDVQMLRPGGHIVLQFKTDNPGVWPLHCHIAWHLSAGLSVNILERPDDIRQMRIPGVVSETCGDWDRYSRGEVVDQIDSGFRI
ncbi:MAG: hypothetical protein M1812_007351 [Candelaria pacifica]|nr:MAG: hypothetical protein M1812_007351 [Candelaria pacifica]